MDLNDVYTDNFDLLNRDCQILWGSPGILVSQLVKNFTLYAETEDKEGQLWRHKKHLQFIVVQKTMWDSEGTLVAYSPMFVGRLAGYQDVHINATFDDCFGFDFYVELLQLVKKFQFATDLY